MFAIGPLGFAAPWLLLGLFTLPLLWLLLRAVPPAPIRRRFPGVALLLGLTDDQSQTDRTPWWLLLLRMLALAALIVGFAGPVLNPQDKRAGDGPLLVLVDATWASARDWSARQERIAGLLIEAGRKGRPVALVRLSEAPAGEIRFQTADAWQDRLAGLQPLAWQPDPSTDWPARLPADEFETFWMSDGVARDSRKNLLAALKTHGRLTVFESPSPLYALRPASFADGAVKLTALRLRDRGVESVILSAVGLDPVGIERDLLRQEVVFAAGELSTDLSLTLPPELRNRVSRFVIAGRASAASVALTDDVLKRREVALIAGREDREGLELLSPLHYLEQALKPTADLIDGDLSDVLPANPDAIVLADVATLADGEMAAVLEWVTKGGLLVRFAGPRLAASDISRAEEDPLMPVRLRVGGRSIGGAMSWDEPKTLRPFAKESPFFGLTIPSDVRVTAQVMAQPDPSLAERVIAALSDGTPLVTRKRIGDGQVVLFHVTANAEWSTLPLSGLFVQMLERLAISTRPAAPTLEDLAGTTWVADRLLTAFGDIELAGDRAGVAGEDLARGGPSADIPPGLYMGQDRLIAVNVMDAEREFRAERWPAGTVIEGLAVVQETGLKGLLLMLALALLMVDLLASLALAGRLKRPNVASIAVGLLAVMIGGTPVPGLSQSDPSSDDFILDATAEVVLAHVITGDAELDGIALAGLRGLSDTLYRRTSIEPADPIGVNLETDELSIFPFLYWPITPNQPQPSDVAYAKLNRYLRTGGMILFDTRDANVARFGGSSPEARKLQSLARPLDIPPLEPIPKDHVLTRTFYLLQDFPGRFTSRDVWVEAAPADAVQVEGMPFRNLNDGVTPVVIGGNDWAGAWAVDRLGSRMFPVGRGYAGEQQRELALRFGVNLIMHVLTGNYKSDQVHVPALLDRLGQ